jgi:hypothetical protein
VIVLTRIEREATLALDSADPERVRKHLWRIFAIARGMPPEPITDANGEVWT